MDLLFKASEPNKQMDDGFLVPVWEMFNFGAQRVGHHSISISTFFLVYKERKGVLIQVVGQLGS
jgi:hypothetical protein